MMLKKSPTSYIVLIRPKQHLHSKKRRPNREHWCGVGQIPSEGQVKTILTTLKCQRGQIMRTLVCEGAWIFIVVGVDPFSLEWKFFLIGVFLGVFCRILSIQESLLGFSKRGGQVISLHTQTWLASNLLLMPSAYTMPSVLIPSASGSLQLYDPVSFMTPSALGCASPMLLPTNLFRRQSSNEG